MKTKKKKEIEIGTLQALTYLGSLLRKSDLFAASIKKLRKELDVDLSLFKKKPLKYEEVIAKNRRVADLLDGKFSGLLTLPSFVETMERFYVHEKFWPYVARFLYTGSAQFALKRSLKVVYRGEVFSQKGGDIDFKLDGEGVPRISIEVPFDVSREEFIELSKNFDDLRRSALPMKELHIWEGAETFDRAFRAYELKKEKKTTKVISDILVTEGRGFTLEMKEHRAVEVWLRKITPQIESMKNIDVIEEMGWL